MYLDSAIIIKLLVEEPDSKFFHDAVVDASVSSSQLAYAEVKSALLAKERGRLILKTAQISAWELFCAKLNDDSLLLHDLDYAAYAKAVHILEICHPKVALRTLDAIHLAACDLSQDFPLCTSDKRMREAAKILHIPVFPE